jgi:phage-related minor tail protein
MAKRRLEVVITGDEAGAAKALRNVDKEAGKAEKGIEGIGKAAAKMDNEVSKGTDNVVSKIKGLAGKLTSVGMTTGLAAGGALVKGLLDGMDTESVNAKMSAQLGFSGKEAKRYGKMAGELYGQAYGESLGQVADALKNVRQQGLVGEDSPSKYIEGVTAKVLDLATAFDQDLAPTTAAIGTLMKTGLAKDANEAMDVITRGFQQGADKQGDFLDTLTEYPTLFRNLGLDARGATGILSQGLKAGARDADKVADALKEFSIRSVDGSKLTVDGFKAIGLNADDMAKKIAKGGPESAEALDLVFDRLRGMKDPVEQSRAAVALFGTQAEDLGQALYAIDPSEAVLALGNVEGAAVKMGDTLNDTAKVKLESFKRQALQKLSDFSVGAFTEVSGLAEKIRPSVTEFWSTLTTGVGGDTGLQQTALKIREVLKGVREGFDSFVAGLRGEGGPGSFFTDLGEGIAAFGRVALPIVQSVAGFVRDHFVPVILGLTLLVAGPIAALVGGFIWLYQTSETFRDIVSGVFATVKAVVTTAIDVIVLWFRYVLAPVFQELQEIVAACWRAVEPHFESMRSFVADKLGPVWEVMRAAAAAAWGALPGIVNGALRIVGGLLSGFLNSSANIADMIGLDHIAKSLRSGAAATSSWGQGSTTNNTGQGQGGIAVVGGIRRREGGFVPGPDVRKDIVPAMLAPREFVMSPEATKFWGVSAMERINQGRMPFRNGGLVPGVDIGGMVHDLFNKGRGAGAAALDRVWPRLPTDKGFASFPAGGANFLRDAAISFIKGKEQEMGSLSGGGFSRSGGGGPAGAYTAGMMRARAAILGQFGNMSVGGYSNRNIAGTNVRSAHSMHRAFDFMVGTGNVSKGNAIANYLISHAGEYGLKGLIWNARKNYGGGWAPYLHPGGARDATSQHLDHVHAEFFRNGGLAGATLHGRSFDSGGVLEPGWNVLANRTGRREALTPGSDADVLRRLDQLIALLSTRTGPLVNIEEVHVTEDADVDRLANRLAFQMAGHMP